ncbi:unnamed protein product [Rodentolepis nana]|uniref:Signal recognition particle receptor subunit beta n=1 Tax=Rodentolepis nana TaxID=102285 RepID=A0A0R3T6K9_RODNA|nr:unnamed protein product [Rodentolepis nana]
MFYIIILAVFFLLFLAFYLSLGSSKKSTVLITGPCESGKTAMLVMLTHKKMPMTFTSLSPNIEEYHQKVKSSNTFKLIDVPGLEKLRFGFINKEKSCTAGIIYVIDSTTFQKNIKDVAEYLYDLMTDETLARSRTPFLIACNKSDLPEAKKMAAIEEHLEMELTTLSRTKAEGLASLEGHKETRVPLVKNTNEKFTFASCKHHAVTFVETSVTSEDIGQVRLWLERL